MFCDFSFTFKSSCLLFSFFKSFKKLSSSILHLSNRVTACWISLLSINSFALFIEFLTFLIGPKLVFMLPSAMLFPTSSTASCSFFSSFLAFSKSSLDSFSVSKYLESISIRSAFSSLSLFSLELASIIIPLSLFISSSRVLIDLLIDSISSCILVFSSSKL